MTFIPITPDMVEAGRLWRAGLIYHDGKHYRWTRGKRFLEIPLGAFPGRIAVPYSTTIRARYPAVDLFHKAAHAVWDEEFVFDRMLRNRGGWTSEAA